MFDRIPQATASSAEAQTSVERLCAVYDRLMQPGADGQTGVLSERASNELKALAGVYDFDVDRTDAEVWRDLRTVLVRQAPRGDLDPTAPVEPLTLMLVEDDPEMAADLASLLSEAGHRIVGPFHSAEAAEAMAAVHPIDLALLDINLSGETDGVELARTLKDRWGVGVLFLSGDLPAAAKHAELAEALVLKPYTGRDVIDAVAQASRARAASAG
jgi:CheY-like chemotaxis protein